MLHLFQTAEDFGVLKIVCLFRNWHLVTFGICWLLKYAFRPDLVASPWTILRVVCARISPRLKRATASVITKNGIPPSGSRLRVSRGNPSDSLWYQRLFDQIGPTDVQNEREFSFAVPILCFDTIVGQKTSGVRIDHCLLESVPRCSRSLYGYLLFAKDGSLWPVFLVYVTYRPHEIFPLWKMKLLRTW